MNPAHLKKYAQMKRPDRSYMAFLDELRKPARFPVCRDVPCRNADAARLDGGVSIVFDSDRVKGLVPETALESLRRLLKTMDIPQGSHAYAIRFIREPSFLHEEYAVSVTRKHTEIKASDGDGFRRAVYFLEDRICESGGPSAALGKWRRKPFIENRISRCFFGPTYRPPFGIDELTDDVNYYPDAYLDRLAHEGVNALWLTIYFKDLPSSIFPGRGADSEKRFDKLRETVKRCARYGIRIFVYVCEPGLWGNTPRSIPENDADSCPELVAEKHENYRCFCNYSPLCGQYIEESVTRLFSAVPDLGGIINIMLGEDNGSCVSYRIDRNFEGKRKNGPCPAECKKEGIPASVRNLAEHFIRPMKKINLKAEYIGWFYAPGQRDGSEVCERLLASISQWPDDASLMFNFESGGEARQLGRIRNVFDYSLAFVGPSKLFRKMSGKVARPAAKIQVGCSHENASVPFIPVPLHLYRKYSAMKAAGVRSVMQCWYFGNYPGLMNKAAGELAFLPFPENRKDFLLHLARPVWHRDAETLVRAWNSFSRGYEQFPANIAFAWYGPLHHSIVWPLHLFPVNAPLAPSWLLESYPRISGDRIGECLVYQHTLPEALALCRKMAMYWEKGLAILRPLKKKYANAPDRLADLNLAEAIGLQIASTVNVLSFYSLREDMFFNKIDHLSEMRPIVENEIVNSEKMADLCRLDSRLGYHSEAEGYLFYPEKLSERIKLLRELLDRDFPAFDLASQSVDEYTGGKIAGASAEAPFGHFGRKQPFGPGMSWSAATDDKNLIFRLEGIGIREFRIEIAASPLWPAVTIFFDGGGNFKLDTYVLRRAEKLKVTGRDQVYTVSLPLRIFDGFRREGFPMRINLRGDVFAWVPYRQVPDRLMLHDFNPACAGWLLTEDGRKTRK